MIELVGIDADDTLWDEATAFDRAEARFVDAVAEWTGDLRTRELLRATHFELIGEVGYGAVGYRVALRRFCEARLADVWRARAIELAHDVCDQLDRMTIVSLPGVEDGLRRLARRYQPILISKGDDAHQRRKLAASGLGWAFADVRIVPEKTADVYRRAFGDKCAAMIGNSLKSDILPAIESGAFGLYVPFHRTSPLEHADPPAGHAQFREFDSFGAAVDWLL